MADSKALGHDDSSGFNFVKEMLAGQVTAAVNFDRLQKHPDRGYIIFEFLKCEEGRTVTPYTSHPDRYWDKNSGKFLALWRPTQVVLFVFCFWGVFCCCFCFFVFCFCFSRQGFSV